MFFSQFRKGNNFCDLLLYPHVEEAIPKWFVLIKEKALRQGEQIFLSRLRLAEARLMRYFPVLASAA